MNDGPPGSHAPETVAPPESEPLGGSSLADTEATKTAPNDLDRNSLNNVNHTMAEAGTEQPALQNTAAIGGASPDAVRNDLTKPDMTGSKCSNLVPGERSNNKQEVPAADGAASDEAVPPDALAPVQESVASSENGQHSVSRNATTSDCEAAGDPAQVAEAVATEDDSRSDAVQEGGGDGAPGVDSREEEVAMSSEDMATDEQNGGAAQDEDWESMSTSSSNNEGRASAMEAALEDVKAKVEQIMAKQKPAHSWSLIRELHKRQRGARPSLLQPDKFRLHMYSSLHAVERLELMALLCGHEGCVNCLHWNQAGDRLASGSDDLRVVVWDWQRQKPAFSYRTGHKSNIFEAKFIPLHADTHIVSTSRDGQVRLAQITPDGECASVRRLAMHRGSGRKLALQPDSPHNLLSCGDDAVVFNIDLREDKPQILTTCMDDGKKVPANSMAAHPEDPNVFLLACVDKFVRIYDRRMIGAERRSFRRLCPHSLLGSGFRYSVTCAQFNHNGSRVVASYNDEDIYLFDSSHSDGADALHQYSGHRNNATIKGVNFYGPTSQHVVSGSDCGNIFFWDVDTEAIVQCMPGDENGVVNCLEPHPHIPVLATSGLDDDVKIWVPSRDEPADLTTLRKTVETNLRERVEEDSPSAESLGGSLMWTLLHQVFGNQRRRRQMMNLDTSEMEDGSSDDDADQPGDCRTS